MTTVLHNEIVDAQGRADRSNQLCMPCPFCNGTNTYSTAGRGEDGKIRSRGCANCSKLHCAVLDTKEAC